MRNIRSAAKGFLSFQFLFLYTWNMYTRSVHMLMKILCVQVKGVEQELDAEDDDAALTSQVE